MSIRHGVYVRELETGLTVPKECPTVPVYVGCAPVFMTDDPDSVVNSPVYVTSATEAMQKLGYISADMDGFGLCEAMYAMSNIHQVGPAVFINVFDPKVHKKTLAEMTTDVDPDTLTAVVKRRGILKNGLTVSTTGDAAVALTEGVDYTVAYETTHGWLTISLSPAGAGKTAAQISVSGSEADPSAVTMYDVIGAYNPSTGAETGMELIRWIYPRYSVVPTIAAAPGWSQEPEVGVSLAAKMEVINGCFKGIALVDIDTATCQKYEDVKVQKEAQGCTTAFSAPIWPCARVGERLLSGSVAVAVESQYLDETNGGIPSMSPSNKALGVTGAALRDGTDVLLDQQQATTVNSFGVMTFLNDSGWRIWGNYTGAFPGSGDVKDIWYCVRRMQNWLCNTFILNYRSKVDGKLSRVLADNIILTENIRLSALVPSDIAGAEVYYLADENPVTDLIAGKIRVHIKWAPYPPAQEIEAIVEYSPDMLEQALAPAA